jgi:HlyD family secretion protein
MRPTHLRFFDTTLCRRLFLALTVPCVGLLGAVATGCNRQSSAAPTETVTTAASQGAHVTTVKPTRHTLRYTIKQPGYNIEAFEQTPVFAKVAGYVQSVNVDIGDAVHKGGVLAELYVPEMYVELKQKEALVSQADAEITQARETATAADASFRSAQAKVKEAESSRERVQAEVRRMKSQYDRFTRVEGKGILDKDSIDEVRYGYEAAVAGLNEVEAKITSAEAARDEAKAKWNKALADVEVAKAHLEVAQQNRDHVKTLLQYTKLLAPFDGVVTRRSVDTGHFVQPAASVGSKAEPLFNVERTDIVRVFVNIPEMDAHWVRDNAPARVRVQGLQGQEFQGKVTRTAKSLDPRSRTLRTEIDLPNSGKLQSGMYVHVAITVEHPDVWSLPASAVVTQGEQTFCYCVENGKAVRTPVQVGIREGDWVEVLQKLRKPAKAGDQGAWEDFSGSEEVVQKDPGSLSEGQMVNVALAKK